MKTSNISFQPTGLGMAFLAIGVMVVMAHDSEVGVTVTPVHLEKLSPLQGQTLTAVTVNYEPGGRSQEHQHAGSVFAYILSGAIRSENSATGPARVYHQGDSFFEPPGSTHLVCDNASDTEPATLLAVFIAEEGAQLTTFEKTSGTAPSEATLARRIFETMLKIPGNQPGHRTVHAKGLVCHGSFTPSTNALEISKAIHFRGGEVPITVRFSNGSPDPSIPDLSPNAGPRGMAIRFHLPDGQESDIVAMSHNGFVVGTGEEFLALQESILATDPTRPHPWPIESFLYNHPKAAQFVQDNQRVPASFATEAFYANNTFLFLNTMGKRTAGRYQIMPIAGVRHLPGENVKNSSTNTLMEDLARQLSEKPVEYRLVLQIPNPGDIIRDSSVIWAADRQTIELGTLRIKSLADSQNTAAQALAFDPTHLTDGIELSDDPLLALRAKVYSLAAAHRQRLQETHAEKGTR